MQGAYIPPWYRRGIHHPDTGEGYTTRVYIGRYTTQGIPASYTTLGTPASRCTCMTELATGTAVRCAGRRGPGLNLRINKRERASARLEASLPVKNGINLCAELLALPVDKTMKDWITSG